jgi:alpha-tubulin suppressor-like RCC1 family protein
MVCTNQSYGIAFVADGRSVEWGQGLCGEVQLQPAKHPPGAKRLVDCDDDEKAALPLLPPPRFLRGGRLPLVSVACGGGHVLAAVGGGGVLCWGADVSEQPLESSLTGLRLQTLGLGGCLDPLCCACAGYGRKRCKVAESFDCNSPFEADARGDESGSLPVRAGERAWWVVGLRRKEVLAVSAGHMFSAALVRDRDAASGQTATALYTWGNGESGQLGLGLAHAEAEADAEDFFAVHVPAGFGGGRSEVSSVAAAGESPAQALLRRRAALLQRAALPAVFNVSCTPQKVAFPAHIEPPPKPPPKPPMGRSSSSFSSSDSSRSAAAIAAADVATAWLLSDVAPVVPAAGPVSVSCGPYHAAVVDAQGQLFTFGAGGRGQLGHGSPLRDEWAPRRVLGLPSKVGPNLPCSRGPGLAAVACGLWHTAAVLESGSLYTWGSGAYGQLGYTVASVGAGGEAGGEMAGEAGVELVVAAPRRVALAEGLVAAVACGWRHTTALGAAHRSPDGQTAQTVHVLGSLKPPHARTAAGKEELLPPGHSRVGPSHVAVALPPARGPVTALASGPWHTVWCPGLPAAPPSKPPRKPARPWEAVLEVAV